MAVAEGVDYAWSKPRASVLRSQGKAFACRYIGRNIDDGKMLTATELASLRGNGLDVVMNVEGTEGGFNSYAAGQDWARKGLAWLSDIRLTGNRPIYFSVDVGSPNWSQVKAACQGAASVIGLDRVGIYGGYNTIAFVHDNNLAKWFWQTYAWSTFNGKLRWHPAAHIQQYRNGVKIDGADCDLDRAMQADYGQWYYEGDSMDEQSIISALYGDLSRNPGTTDPNGQSGLNRLFRQFDREETAALLKPITATLAAIAQQQGVDTAALQASISQVDEQVVAKLGDTSQSVQDTARLAASLLGDRAAAVAQAILDLSKPAA